MVQPLHLVGFPELNRYSIAETDIERAVYRSNNTDSGHLHIYYSFIYGLDEDLLLVKLGLVYLCFM